MEFGDFTIWSALAIMFNFAEQPCDAAKPIKYPRQFDIICSVTGRTIVDYRRLETQPEPGRMGPARWKDRLHYAIDLRRGLYVSPDWAGHDPEKIAVSTDVYVYFEKSAKSYARFNLRTARYESWGRGEGFLDEAQSGSCRRTRFSGFR